MFRFSGGQPRNNRFEQPNFGARDQRNQPARWQDRGSNQDKDANRGGDQNRLAGGQNRNSTFPGRSNPNQPTTNSRPNTTTQSSTTAQISGSTTGTQGKNVSAPSASVASSKPSSTVTTQSGISGGTDSPLISTGSASASPSNAGNAAKMSSVSSPTPAMNTSGNRSIASSTPVTSSQTLRADHSSKSDGPASLNTSASSRNDVSMTSSRGGRFSSSPSTNQSSRGDQQDVKREFQDAKQMNPPHQQQQRSQQQQRPQQQQRSQQQQQRSHQQRSTFDQSYSQNQSRLDSGRETSKYDSDMPQEDEEEEEEEKQQTAIAPQRKFTGRCRLFVGNMTSDTTEEDFVKMFEQFGETSEAFLNAARGFGFIRMDTRHNAENARIALDGLQRKGRYLRVRFAAHGAALRVKYLSQHVSNEMLEQTFGLFGDVEHAVVVVDDRGRPTGEGIVEFARKPGALAALKRISDGVFLMTSSLRPIMVEPLEDKDETGGLPEIFFQQTPELMKEREQPPRFAQVNTAEYEYGMKWKNLYQMYKEREELLKRNFEEEASKLEMDQETAKLQMHADLLRQDLMRRQEELRRLEEQTQLELQRRQEMRMMEEERRRKELEMIEARRRQAEMFQQQQQLQKQQQQQQQQQQMQQQQQQHSQEWQQQQLQQQQQHMRDVRGGVTERGALGTPLQPPPVPPGISNMERARSQGISVLAGGGAASQLNAGGSAIQGGAANIPQVIQELTGQQQANLVGG